MQIFSYFGTTCTWEERSFKITSIWTKNTGKVENVDAMLPSIMYFTLHAYLYFVQRASGMHIRA